jgi:hypothetical protein
MEECHLTIFIISKQASTMAKFSYIVRMKRYNNNSNNDDKDEATKRHKRNLWQQTKKTHGIERGKKKYKR